MAHDLAAANSFGAGEYRRRRRHRWGRRHDGQGQGQGPGNDQGQSHGRPESQGHHEGHCRRESPGHRERHGHREGQGCRCRAHGHPHTAAHQTPLSHVAAGSTVTVTGIEGDEALRGKIMAMGIMPGASISVLTSCRRRPLMLALAGSRIVLDRQTSHSITVREGLPLPRVGNNGPLGRPGDDGHR